MAISKKKGIFQLNISFPDLLSTAIAATANVIRYATVCEYTNHSMVNCPSNRLNHSKNPTMSIINTLSRMERKLSVLNKSKPDKLDLRYRINDRINWLKANHESIYNSRPSYPQSMPPTIISTAYSSPSTSFSMLIPDKCLFSSWLFWAIFLLLKLVIPRSRKI